MSEFKEKELLEYFDDMCVFLANHNWTKIDERAVAIKKMIQAYAECQEIKADYMNMIFQRDLLQAQLEKKKLEVTEEFIRKWADVIRHADTGLFGIKGELKLVRQMLREAGVSVA